VAVRDHSVLVGTFFLCFTQHAGTSLGGVPCCLQDRVRERREGLFAANQCWRVCDDRPPLSRPDMAATPKLQPPPTDITQNVDFEAGRRCSSRYSRYGVSTSSIHFMNARTRRDRLLRCATTRDTVSDRRRKSGMISTSAPLFKYWPIPKSGA
jgi:hypothetical protein